MARGARLSQTKKSLIGRSKDRRDREMAYIYLRTCRQRNAPEGKWCRAGIYKCVKIYNRKRVTVRQCIRNVVENGRNRPLAAALAPWVPSAKPSAGGTAADRRYLELDEATILAALTEYISE